MREVDHDRKGPPRHHLESARNLWYACEPVRHGVEGHAGDRAHTRRRQTIFDIEAADERQVDVDFAGRACHAEPGSGRTRLDHFRS